MKITRLFTVVMISMVLTACGSKESASSVAESEAIVETDGLSEGSEEIPAVEITEKAQETEGGKSITPERSENKKEAGEEKSKNASKKDDNSAVNLTGAQEKQKSQGLYEDNFAVESSVAAEFAEKIKAAVANKDMEALADLTAFPVYVGIAEHGVNTREEFIALGADTVFTTGLIESVEGADTSNLSPSMAGFSISKDGKSNIIFGVVEGKLAISGINYE